LLAMYGLDDKGRVYLHVKVFKNRKVYGEILALSGEIELRCRECFRWYRVVIKPNQKPHLVETPEPEPMPQEAVVGDG
jgi:hypothetical protein